MTVRDIQRPATIRLDVASPATLAGLEGLRRLRPLVHCNTNSIAAGFMANVLLAIGASPVMAASREEVAELAAVAGAISISVASVTEDKADALLRSAAAAKAAGTPWVLDPVAVGALGFRTWVVDQLLAFQPTVIKGNASEILTLAGYDGRSQGADSTACAGEALAAACELSVARRAVVVVTGATDYVADGRQVYEICGGHPLMAQVTGTGCALGAVIAAFLAAGLNPQGAATAACCTFALAGEKAGRVAQGSGSFAACFLDQLCRLGLSD